MMQVVRTPRFFLAVALSSASAALVAGPLLYRALQVRSGVIPEYASTAVTGDVAGTSLVQAGTSTIVLRVEGTTQERDDGTTTATTTVATTWDASPRTTIGAQTPSREISSTTGPSEGGPTIEPDPSTTTTRPSTTTEKPSNSDLSTTSSTSSSIVDATTTTIYPSGSSVTGDGSTVTDGSGTSSSTTMVGTGSTTTVDPNGTTSSSSTTLPLKPDIARVILGGDG